MLPASGYFRSVTCPFFSSGLCERPHCQFQHKTVTDVSENEKQLPHSDVSEDSSDRPNLLQLVRQAISQVQKEVEEGHVITKPNLYGHVNGDNGLIRSDVEAVEIGISRDVNKSSSQHQMRTEIVAEYKPTPIVELKKRKGSLQNSQSGKLEYEPSSLTYGKSSQSSTVVYVPSSKSKQEITKYSPNSLVQLSKPTSAVKKCCDSSDSSSSDSKVEDVVKSTDGGCSKISSSNISMGCDVLNQILSESIKCDTLMNAASVRRISCDNNYKLMECVSKEDTVGEHAKKSISKNSTGKPKNMIDSTKDKSSRDVNLKNKGDCVSSCNVKKGKDKGKVHKKSKKAKVNSLISIGSSTNSTRSNVDHLEKCASIKVESKKRPLGKNSECFKQAKIDLLSADSSGISGLDEKVPQPSLQCCEAEIAEKGFTFNDSFSDVDEANTYEECLKIFNEYVPVSDAPNSSGKKREQNMEADTTEQVTASGKKRLAHNPNHVAKQFVNPNRFKSSPAQVMHARLLHMQKILEEAKEKNSCHSSQPSCSSQSLSDPSSDHIQRRTAHTPTISPLASQKLSLIGNKAKTVAQTSGKGIQRIAHLPGTKSVRPTIPAEFGSKVPTNIRQRYLNLIIDECLKFYDRDQDAFQRGCAEEKNAYERSSSRVVYLNVVANTIKKLRAEDSFNISERSLATSTVDLNSVVKQQRRISHEFVLGGKKAANVSYSIERPKNKPSKTSISGEELYQSLRPYILTKEQLYENGFPLAHPTEPGRAIINKPAKKKGNSCDALEKICSRCGSPFKVSPKGEYLTKDECFYHWGRAIKVRSAGAYETRYTCCQTGLHSEGCCVGKLHVFDDIDQNCHKGFIKTLPKSPPLNRDYGVFALDCEMCYTTMGMELARVTVIASNLSPVYESLVKPENPVIDYNTRFSGIVESDLAYVNTTLRDVQAILLNKFSDKTILIGHSLESDFKALKLIHEIVVDTSVVFPHKMGLPYKRALRTLVAEYLKKIIQNSLDGHDSHEDAAGCMELMMWKLKEDMKLTM